MGNVQRTSWNIVVGGAVILALVIVVGTLWAALLLEILFTPILRALETLEARLHAFMNRQGVKLPSLLKSFLGR